MTDIEESGGRRRRRKNDTAHRDNVGAWSELIFEKSHGFGDASYSNFDLLLRQEYKNALEGKPAAVRTIMRMLEANLDERKMREEFLEREAWHDRQDKPRRDILDNASPALLILGIGALDSEALKRLGEPGDPRYEARLKALTPSCIEPWAVEAALSQPDAPCGTGREVTMITAKHAAPDLSEWEVRKAGVIEELMRLRGPGATRFAPGKSGNRRGRPPKRTEPFPYDDFFMAPVTMKIGGKERTITRLDALMYRLTGMAAKGDEPLRRLILPALMKLHDLRWKEEGIVLEIVRR